MKCCKLDGAARARGRADAASRADRLDHLGDRLSAPQLLFLDGLERTGLDALEAAHAGVGVDPRDGRVRFEHVLREQGEDLCGCRASLADGSRDILRPLGGARQIDPCGIRLHGAKLGMALHVEAVRIVRDVELLGELRPRPAPPSRQWRGPRGRPRPPPACRGAYPRPGRPSSFPWGICATRGRARISRRTPPGPSW